MRAPSISTCKKITHTHTHTCGEHPVDSACVPLYWYLNFIIVITTIALILVYMMIVMIIVIIIIVIITFTREHRAWFGYPAGVRGALVLILVQGWRTKKNLGKNHRGLRVDNKKNEERTIKKTDGPGGGEGRGGDMGILLHHQ